MLGCDLRDEREGQGDGLLRQGYERGRRGRFYRLIGFNGNLRIVVVAFLGDRR